jgi:DNA-binding ferritin-like protein
MTIKTDVLSRRSRTSSSRPLNELLIDEYLLYTETRICHWHLEDQQEPRLRNFLRLQYEALDMLLDRVTAYMRAEGHRPMLRPRAFQHISAFLEDDTVPAPLTMLKNLTQAHDAIAQRIQKISRSGSAPAGSAILLQELTMQHKQMHCLLKAHLTLGMLQAHLPTGQAIH